MKKTMIASVQTENDFQLELVVCLVQMVQQLIILMEDFQLQVLLFMELPKQQ